MNNPREEYLKIQEKIAEDNAKANGVEIHDEDLADAVKNFEDDEDANEEESEDKMPEKVLDKTMGTQKLEVTREQYLASKNKKGPSNPEDEHKAQLQYLQAKAEQGKITDPVLKYLLEQKIKVQTEYNEASSTAKQLNARLMQELNTIANKLMKAKGAMESVDKQILDLVSSRPTLLD